MITSSMEYEILSVIILAVITCSIPGIFIVLRKGYYSTDTANRSSLLGIALVFGVVGGLSSPLVALGGALSSAAAVWVADKVTEITRFRKKGLSLLTGSFFLSAGILSAVKLSGSVDFELSTIYQGETAFTYFSRLRIFGIDIGSYALYSILTAGIINIILAVIFYKKFKIESIDKEYAHLLGVNSRVLDFILMVMVSLSVAVSYQTAGIFMTTAFILVPASTAYFWSNQFYKVVIYTIIAGILACYAGFNFSWQRELSISGSVVMFMGIIFIISVVFAPYGILRKYLKNLKHRKILEEYIFMDILLNRGAGSKPLSLDDISKSLNWHMGKGGRVLKSLVKKKLVEIKEEIPVLTEDGILKVKNYMNS